MAEIDIDKMLAKKDEEEKRKKNKKALMTGLAAGAAVLIMAMIAVVIVFMVIGESSTPYFPLKNGARYTYNRKDKSPQQWEILNKNDMVGEYECRVLNIVDQGNHSSEQGFYCEGKAGIIKLATSEDNGKKRDDKMRLLPARLKKGAEFEAGSIRGVQIKGMIESKEKISTPVGEVDAYKVVYSAGEYMDRDVWYGRDVGVLKIVDRKTGDRLDLISMVDK